MEAIILAIRLGLRRAWRGLVAFLDRHKLSDMPPVKTIAVFLAIGLLVPLAMGIDRTPASLSRSLADQRLERFAGTELPDVSPSGATFCSEPAFFWKKHPQAASYRLRLFRGDPVVQSTTVTEAHYVLPSPGELTPGEYRFTVEALNADGATLGEVADSTFSIEKPYKQLEQVVSGKNTKTFFKELDPADAAYVLAGLYAEHGSVHDVRSALARYVSLIDNDQDAELARSILGR